MANTVIGASVQIEFQSVGNMRKALKEANQELLAMQDRFGATSKEAIAAAQKVADLKDKIDDARNAADVFDPGKKFQVFADVGAKIAAGFSAVQGAMALVGAESKDVEKALLKVQGAMALAQGLSQLKDFGEAWNKVKLFVGNATQGMSAFKRALVSTGIGLFVVAIGTLIAYWDELRDAIKGTNDVTRAYAEAQGEVSKKVSEATQKITEVTTALDLAKKGKISSTEALEIYNNTLGDTFGQAESLAQAEKLMADNTAAYIQAIKLRTQAQVFYAKAAEAAAKATSGEGIDPTFLQSLEDAFLGAGSAIGFTYEQEKTRAENLGKLYKTQKTFTTEADKLMEQALLAESKYKTNSTKINSKANASRVSSTKTTNNEIAKLEQQRLEALAIAEEARLSLLSEKDRELELLNKKRIEEIKKLELGGIKEGSEQRLKFDEAYRVKRQEILDKYDKEEKEREKEFQNTLIAIQEETRLAGIKDAREKEKADLIKSYTDRLSEIDKNERYLSDEKTKLREALLIQQKQAEDALQQKFDQEDLQKDATKLLEQSNQEDLSFAERLAKIKAREDLESQIIFENDQARTDFQKQNSDARNAIVAAEAAFRIEQAQKTADVLQGLSDVVGKETAAGKALAVAAATINTYLAASKALTGIKSGNPIGAAIAIAQAATVIAVGIKNVREILKVKVPGGGGPGPGPAPAPPPPSTLAPLTTAISPAVQGQMLNADAINNLGNTALRAYVMNSDIQNNDQRNAYLQRNARIG